MSVPSASCPECSARLAPDAQWCSLCFHDLRPPAEPVPEPVPVVRAAGPGASTRAPALARSQAARSGGDAGASDRPVAEDDEEQPDALSPEELADQLLAQLRAAESYDARAALGPAGILLGSMRVRMVLATAAALLLAALAVGLMALAGVLLD